MSDGAGLLEALAQRPTLDVLVLDWLLQDEMARWRLAEGALVWGFVALVQDVRSASAPGRRCASARRGGLGLARFVDEFVQGTILQGRQLYPR